MAHVFISYSHTDTDFVTDLAARLQKEGIPTWLDHERLRVGDDWRQEIDDGISSGFALIVVISKAATRSQYVTYEWAYAMGLGIPVIPLLRERHAELHPRLEAIQFLEYTDEREAIAYPKLVEAIKVIQFGPRPDPRAKKKQIFEDAPVEVKQAIEELDSHVAKARKRAVQNLAAMQYPVANEALVNALQHPTWDVRLEVAFVLGQRGYASAMPILNQALNDNNADIRRRAVDALTTIPGDGALESLLEAARDPDQNVVMSAHRGLAQIGSDAAIQAIAGRLTDGNDRIAENALRCLLQTRKPAILNYIKNVPPRLQRSDIPQFLEALQDIEGPEVVALLEQFLQSPYRGQVTEAILARQTDIPLETLFAILHSSGGPSVRVVRLIWEQYGEEGLEQFREFLLDAQMPYAWGGGESQQVAQFLSQTNSVQAVVVIALLEMLASHRFHGVDRVAGVLSRMNADIVGKGLLDALVVVSKSPPHESHSIWTLLGEYGNDSTVGPINQWLDHPDSTERKQAAAALGKIGTSHAVDMLNKAVAHQLKDVRESAIGALAQTQQAQALQGLLHAIQGNEPELRLLAVAYVLEWYPRRPEAVTCLAVALRFRYDKERNVVVVARGYGRTSGYYGHSIEDQITTALRKIGTPEALAAVKQLSRWNMFKKK